MFTSAEHNGSAGARAEEALRHKASQLQKFFDDVEELLGKVSDNAEPEVARLRSRVESSLGRMSSSVRDGTRAAIDGTRKAAVATDKYVHDNPWVAIGAGAAAGLVVGALLRGRSRK